MFIPHTLLLPIPRTIINNMKHTFFIVVSFVLLGARRQRFLYLTVYMEKAWVPYLLQ